MNHSCLVLFLGLVIGALHLREHPAADTSNTCGTVAWPATFEGAPLRPLPLSDLEQEFARSFPGSMAHFQSGDRQIILRQVTRATRRLHSSATCLRAAGFKIEATGTEIHHRSPWATCRASKPGTVLHVREQIRRTHHPHEVWTEVSRWFWAAMTGPEDGPWTAVTVLHIP